MRNPLHVLKSLEEQSCNKEYRYVRLYRNLYNPEFYLLAYKNIAKSQGSMTAGADGMSLDDMSTTARDKRQNNLAPKQFIPITIEEREYGTAGIIRPGWPSKNNKIGRAHV